ncbi:MAG: hypothetical protein ACOX7B_06895 [Christensenellales bacterium]|jgi:putative aldouronate transport system substrate-binding protein
MAVMTKRFISLVLALMMLLAFTAAFAEEAVPLNTYTYWEPEWPIVKDGEQLTVSVATSVNSAYYQEPEKTWFWVWSEKATGIDFDVRQITSEALTEQKNLMFASNNLPDVMIGLWLSTGELVRYGMSERQLLDLTPYINAETMPYLTKWLEKYPEIRALATTPDGAIYSLPFIKMKSDYFGSHERVSYNMNWLREVYPDLPEVPDTLEAYLDWVEATKNVLPKTLDQFTELLYAFKELHPDSTPLGGIDAGENPFSFLLNAFGYLTTANNDYGYMVALKNGKPTIPATDPDFIEFLKLANQYYVDGIIEKDFFTADKLIGTIQLTDNKCGVSPSGAPYGALPEPEKYHQWDTMYLLTSQWNESPQVLEASLYNVGGAVLSAGAKNVEAILNYLDFFYSDLGIYYLWCGPINGSVDTLGMVEGFYYDVEAGAKAFPDVVKGDYESSLAYVYSIGLGQWGAFGNRSHSITDESYANMMQTLQHLQGTPDEEINRNELAYNHGDNYARICTKQRNTHEYAINGYPHIVYYTEDQQATIDEISLILNDYIKSEVAKFITGATAVTQENFDQFVKDCNAYGAKELIAIYEDVYQNYLNIK